MNRKILLSAVSCMVLLIGTLGWAAYRNDRIWFDSFDKLDQSLWPYQQFLGKARHLVGSVVDELNPARGEQKILSDLEVYHLSLSPQDVHTLLTRAKKDFESSNYQKPGRNFRKIEVTRDGVRHKAQMKIHGDGEAHWLGKKKSFQLKFSKDAYVDGRRRMLFILPENREYLVPMFATEVAKFLKLPFIETKMVAVTINGVFQGMYYWEEHINEKFLERKGIPDGVIVELSDNWIDDRLGARGDATKYYGGITYNDHHNTPFNLEISNVVQIDSEHAQLVYNKTKELLDAVRVNDMEKFESLIDIEQIGAADAWRTLLGDRHSLVGDNNKMVYLLSAGKFIFLPRSEGDSRLLEFRGGSFESHLNRKAGRIVRLFEMMARSDRIREVRNQSLVMLVKSEDELLAVYDRLVDRYLPLLKMDDTLPDNTRKLSYMIRKQRNIIQSNIARLRTQLEHAKAYVNLSVRENRIDIDLIPDTSFQSLAIERFALELNDQSGEDASRRISFQQFDESRGQFFDVDSHEGRWPYDLAFFWKSTSFGFDLDQELEPTPRHHRYRLVFEGEDEIAITKADLSFRETLTGNALSEADIYLSIADENNDLSEERFQTPAQFVAKHPELNLTVNDGHLLIPAGIYQIEEHTVIPEGTKLVVSAGTEIAIAPGKVVLSYSPVEMIGTSEQPIRITSSDPNKPFGSFAVVGNHETTSRVHHVDVSRGSEAFLNGIYFSGAFCFYHADVEIDHSHVHHNQADDGLNVKHGKINISNSRFIDNHADQVDLDFIRGTVETSEFRVAPDRGNLGGDGLDVSGSSLLIRNSSFLNMPDKGISVGESSKTILTDNLIKANQIGLAVKDSSHALVLNNQFIANDTAISSYQKKQIFSGGHVYILFNTWEENGKKTNLDEASKVYKPTSEGTKYIQSMTFRADSTSYEELFAIQNWIATQ